MKKITLKRGFNLLNISAVYDVIIDGKKAGELKNNTSLPLTLEENAKEIIISSSSFSSKPLEIDKIQNQDVLIVKPHYRSLLAFGLVLFYLGIIIFDITWRFKSFFLLAGLALHFYSMYWKPQSFLQIVIKK